MQTFENNRTTIEAKKQKGNEQKKNHYNKKIEGEQTTINAK